MKTYGKFPFDPKLKQLFCDKVLSTQWFEQYPMLFTEDDLRLAQSQSDHHFFEWLGAIKLYEDLRYLCMVEKYQFRRKYPKQNELFKSIVPPDVYKIIYSDEYQGRQAPDLFAYSEDKNDWFFCEVKGGADKFSKGQKTAFIKLENAAEKEIQVIYFVQEKQLS